MLLMDRHVRECEMVDTSLHCLSSRENLPPSAALAVDFTPVSIFARGDGIVRCFRASAKNNERQ